jgi:hypothetical protein
MNYEEMFLRWDIQYMVPCQSWFSAIPSTLDEKYIKKKLVQKMLSEVHKKFSEPDWEEWGGGGRIFFQIGYEKIRLLT